MQVDRVETDADPPNGGPVYQSINDADLEDDAQPEKTQLESSLSDGYLNDQHCACNGLRTRAPTGAVQRARNSASTAEIELARPSSNCVELPRRELLSELGNRPKTHSLAKLLGMVCSRKCSLPEPEADTKPKSVCSRRPSHTSRSYEQQSYDGSSALFACFGRASAHERDTCEQLARLSRCEERKEKENSKCSRMRFSTPSKSVRKAWCAITYNRVKNDLNQATPASAIEIQPTPCTSSRVCACGNEEAKRLISVAEAKKAEATDYPLQSVGAGTSQTRAEVHRNEKLPDFPWLPQLGRESDSKARTTESEAASSSVQTSGGGNVNATGSDPNACRSTTVYTRIDYRHHLVQDLQSIFSLPFYFGTVDRFAAETILADRPDGSFLLRDSAQSDYLFSVSFRRFERTLHARIEIVIVHELEQMPEHADSVHLQYTFDAYERTSVSAPTVAELLKQYNAIRPMYFEPSLTAPVCRPFAFSLKQLCRAAVCSAAVQYERIAELPLPASIKAYLREYHYKEPVSLQQFEVPMPNRNTNANGKKLSHSESLGN